MSPARRRSVAVVGAGLGGLSAAVYLAGAGHRVRVFEKNSFVGGKLSRLDADGFRFDLGPSVLTLPDVFRDLFAVAGRDFDAALDVVRLDPVCRYHFADGTRFDLPDGLDAQLDAVAALNPAETDAYRRFARYARELYEASSESFLFRPFGDFGAFGREQGLGMLRQLPRLLTPRSLDGLVRRFFRDPRLVQLFDRYATYTGSSPFSTPATFAVIPHVEHILGCYYVRGGMYRLAEAVVDLARSAGVEVETGRPVSGIEVRDRRAVGLRLADGERIEADIVVVNTDAVGAYQRLLPADAEPRVRRRLLRSEPSTSALIELLGLAERVDSVAHHNIYFSADYRDEFDDLFSRRTAPKNPTVYVSAPSRSDTGVAPPGGESLFVMINMPAATGREDWGSTSDALFERVHARLAEGGLSLDPARFVHRSVLTPADIASRYGSANGAIYGPSSNTRRLAFLRPRNQSARVGGLFFAGGGSHPGGGLPLVTLSGKICAGLVEKYVERSR